MLGGFRTGHLLNTILER